MPLQHTKTSLQVLPIGEVLMKLEDSGEVGVEIAEHQLTKEETGEFRLAPSTAVAFVLDPLKSEKKKKKAI